MNLYKDTLGKDHVFVRDFQECLFTGLCPEPNCLMICPWCVFVCVTCRFPWSFSSVVWSSSAMPPQSADRTRTRTWWGRCVEERWGNSVKSVSASTSSWYVWPSWWWCRTSWRSVSAQWTYFSRCSFSYLQTDHLDYSLLILLSPFSMKKVSLMSFNTVKYSANALNSLYFP